MRESRIFFPRGGGVEGYLCLLGGGPFSVILLCNFKEFEFSRGEGVQTAPLPLPRIYDNHETTTNDFILNELRAFIYFISKELYVLHSMTFASKYTRRYEKKMIMIERSTLC